MTLSSSTKASKSSLEKRLSPFVLTLANANRLWQDILVRCVTHFCLVSGVFMEILRKISIDLKQGKPVSHHLAVAERRHQTSVATRYDAPSQHETARLLSLNPPTRYGNLMGIFRLRCGVAAARHRCCAVSLRGRREAD